MPQEPDYSTRIAALQQQLDALKLEGDYLIGVRIERSPAGGTASQGSKETCKYARLRAGKGKLLPNGKKSRYIPLDKVTHYEAACERGKQIQRLERELQQLQYQQRRAEQTQYRRWGHKPRQTQLPKTSRSLAPPLQLHPQDGNSQLIDIEVQPPKTLAAILVLYRQSTTTPVHAVAAEIWQGDQKVVDVKAIHCMGMRADRLTAYIKELLQSLSEQYGVIRFEDVVKEVPVSHCPLEPCPFKTQVLRDARGIEAERGE
jgi:hypothetical protein